jgi:hypothetical protein
MLAGHPEGCCAITFVVISIRPPSPCQHPSNRVSLKTINRKPHPPGSRQRPPRGGDAITLTSFTQLPVWSLVLGPFEPPVRCCPKPVPPYSGCTAEGMCSVCKKWRDNMSSLAVTAAAGEPFRWAAIISLASYLCYICKQENTSLLVA